MNNRTAPDPATLEIIRNRLLAAAEDMRVTLVRSAYTPTIYESEDCAIGLLDRYAEVIALSTGLPLFLGNLGQAVADSVKLRGGAATMSAGDVYLLNDSYLQGTHMQDCTAYAPVFWESELIGYAVARAHMVDLGSIEPGGGMASTTIYHEGLRLGPVRIFDADGPCHDMLDVLRRNSRSKDELIGDVQAMVAAVRTGVQRMREITQRWGVEVLGRTRDAIFAYSDHATRQSIGPIPDGVYMAQGCLDDDGIDIGQPVTIAVTVIVDGDRIHVDLAGTSPMVRGAINCGKSQTVSSIRVALRLLLGGDRAPDGGTFRPITVTVPRGCFLNAEEPAACGNYAASAVLLMDLVMRAFAQVLPGQVCAGQYGDTVTEFIWTDPRTNQLLILGEAHAGGWGAGVDYPGASAVIDLTNGSFKNFSVELLESRYPVVVTKTGIRRESGGAGRFRGGDGLERTYRLTEPGSMRVWMDRVLTPPWGLAGGSPGKTALVKVHNSEGEQVLWKSDGLALQAGDEVTVVTAGGGGYESKGVAS